MNDSEIAFSGDAAGAADTLTQTLLAVIPDSELVKSQTLPYGEYRAFTLPGRYGPDIMEYLIKSEGVGERNWEGDKEGPLVTYRWVGGWGVGGLAPFSFSVAK